MAAAARVHERRETMELLVINRVLVTTGVDDLAAVDQVNASAAVKQLGYTVVVPLRGESHEQRLAGAIGMIHGPALAIDEGNAGGSVDHTNGIIHGRQKLGAFCVSLGVASLGKAQGPASVSTAGMRVRTSAQQSFHSTSLTSLGSSHQCSRAIFPLCVDKDKATRVAQNALQRLGPATRGGSDEERPEFVIGDEPICACGNQNGCDFAVVTGCSSLKGGAPIDTAAVVHVSAQ
mmetsp:Transcript_168669/g.409981  ORF Transcript_168669/g.409981 Transcript_168669/m.409981 type:complete len:234 (-) Transcript_168669:1467-2168(-)